MISKINAYTKQGNPYHKTNTNKKAGFAVGTLGLGAAFGVYLRMVQKEPMLKQELSETISLLGKAGKFKYGAIIVGIALAVGAVGLAIGSIVDGIVNSARRHKADKAEV